MTPLLELVSRNNGYVTPTQATRAGIPRRKLTETVAADDLAQVDRGLYALQLKGDMLISSLVGVASGTAMDLDATIRGFDLAHASGRRAFCEANASQQNLLVLGAGS